MKNLFVLLIVVFLFSNQDFTFAQKKGKYKQVKEKSKKEEIIIQESQIIDPYNGKIKVENTESFFESFISKKTDPKKSDFETQEEYQKRIPAPYDSSQIVYFPIAESIRYKYNIDIQELSFISGWFPEYQSKPNGLLIIKRNRMDLGTEDRSNAYGAVVTIKKSSETEYFLNILNRLDIPDSLMNIEILYDSTNYNSIRKFTLKHLMSKIQAAPTLAKEMTETLEILIGVKPISYKKSSFNSDIPLKPSRDYPYLKLEKEYIIDCKVSHIILFDKSSKNILKEYYIK